jgi:putative membrane protein
MIAKSLVAYMHFLCAFGIAATLFYEWFTFSRTPTAAEARRLALADRWYGIFAGALLVAGFTRAFHFEKGMDFYLHSPFFHLKLTLFVVIGLLSIYPTIRFARWRPDIQAGRAPTITDSQFKLISRSLGAEMILLVALLLCASLMANGVGAR